MFRWIVSELFLNTQNGNWQNYIQRDKSTNAVGNFKNSFSIGDRKSSQKINKIIDVNKTQPSWPICYLWNTPPKKNHRVYISCKCTSNI